MRRHQGSLWCRDNSDDTKSKAPMTHVERGRGAHFLLSVLAMDETHGPFYTGQRIFHLFPALHHYQLELLSDIFTCV